MASYHHVYRMNQMKSNTSIIMSNRGSSLGSNAFAQGHEFVENGLFNCHLLCSTGNAAVVIGVGLNLGQRPIEFSSVS
jgi:hypothetical protein